LQLSAITILSIRTMSARAALSEASALPTVLGDLSVDIASLLFARRAPSSTRGLSSNARLLRKSKLFSLPPPLPRPDARILSMNPKTISDTATLPHPTNQAIETTPSSLARGDWGLKRPLPLKSTLSSTTPVIRIAGVDNIDHITEFESAADHVFTLQKWQEMNIPVTVPGRKRGSGAGFSRMQAPKSIFEDSMDPRAVKAPESFAIIARDPGQTSSADVEGSRRWRYEGPWLAGQTLGEFEDYVQKTIKSKRLEFKDFIVKRLAERRQADPRQNMEQGLGMADRKPAFEQRMQRPERDLEGEILALRHQPADLNAFIWDFLDLPGRLPINMGGESGRLNQFVSDMIMTDLEQGPPATHPSAGLSYLRTAAHVHNHPQLGPMNLNPPVQARVMRRNQRSAGHTLFGVGGVVAERATGDGFAPKDQPLRLEGIDNPGGPKMWVHPAKASIDTRGRIRLNVDVTHLDTVIVWHGLAEPSVAMDSMVGGGDREVPNLAPYKRELITGFELSDFTNRDKGKGIAASFMNASRPRPANKEGAAFLNQ